MKINKLAVSVCIAVSCLTCSVTSVKADTTQNEFEQAYEVGRSKGILTDQNMTKDEFFSLCKDSVFPSYVEYSTNHPGTTFADYIADDNYEVPLQKATDEPETVSATGDKSNASSLFTSFFSTVSARKGYSMKAGDILICYGRNITSKYVGHAAIASSSKYIMEMTGPGHRAEHTSKATFFKRNSGNKKYVAVFRIKNHPKYADDAASYAYHHMYIHDNPWYLFPSSMYQKSPSYCSKYVYIAYQRGATSKALYPIPGPSAVILPHGMWHWFKDSFTPSYVYKVTSY